MQLEVGAPAPPFTLPGADGQPLALSSLAGKKVVLYFYPKDDTSGCTQEAIEFNGLKAEFEAAGAEVIGLSAGQPQKPRQVCRKARAFADAPLR